MKTILVLSDTHGNISAMEKLKNIMRESDYIFHLGDYEKDISIFREFSGKVVSVKGNCDGGGTDKVIEIEGIKFFLTHGDRYGVKNGLLNLKLKAQEIQADVVFYGHTHRANIELIDGIYFINSGNLISYYGKSYCYCVVYGGKITAKIVEI